MVNGTDVSDNLTAVDSSVEDSLYILERSASDSLLLSFPSGIVLTFNYTNGIFNYILNLPQSFNSSTQGLMGTLNSNISDDLIFRNRTVLSINSSDAEKHEFGQSC